MAISTLVEEMDWLLKDAEDVDEEEKVELTLCSRQDSEVKTMENSRFYSYTSCYVVLSTVLLVKPFRILQVFVWVGGKGRDEWDVYLINKPLIR